MLAVKSVAGVMRLLTVVLFVCGSAAAQPAGGPSVQFEVLSASDAVHPGDEARLAVKVKLTEGWHMNAHKPLDKFLKPTVLEVQPPEGAILEKIIYPEPKLLTFSFSTAPLAVYEHEFDIGVLLKLTESITPGSYSAKGKLRWQACNDKVCWMPLTTEVEIPFTVIPTGQSVAQQNEEVFKAIDFESGEPVAPAAATPTAPAPVPAGGAFVAPEPGSWQDLASDFVVTGRNSGYIRAGDFLQWLDDVKAGKGASELGLFQGRSLLAVVLLTILGGLALNLTPCVLPLIPINLAIIGAGAQAGSRTRGFALGALYGLGIALVYGGLGLLVVLGTGTFGSLNASPWFNLIIAIVFVALGLAMFDLFLIDFTRFQGKLNLGGRRGSFLLAFAMGCVIALLAGACVAPVVIAVVLLSRDLYAQGSPVGLLLPFFLGLGMALPWPFAGAGLSFLPKPGKWMERVKYAFGVLILGFAIYYGWEATKLFRDRYFVDRDAVVASTRALDEEGWTSSLEDGLKQAKEEGKPVFVDFWATWCKSCMTMNVTTFKDPEVQKRLKDYVKVKYQAESPDEPPAKEVMQYFGVDTGLPSYRLLEPK